MIKKLEQKQYELVEITDAIKKLQKRRKSVYNYIYTTEKRQKEKKV
jgi:sensor histidine kinase YesM